jgi:hypothetical protein
MPGGIEDKGTVEVNPSTVHESLHQDNMLAEKFWCIYCCYGGEAISGKDIMNPICASETVDLTHRTFCMTTDVMGADDGLCGCAEVSEEVFAQCQCPPLKGSPTVVCCNKDCAGKREVTYQGQLFDYGKLLNESCILCYCICAGYGISGLMQGDRPIAAAVEKCLCVKGGFQMRRNDWPGPGGGCCKGEEICDMEMSKCLCFWKQSRLPPADAAPLCAICNQKKPVSKRPLCDC